MDWSHIVANERKPDHRDIQLGAVQAPVAIPASFLPDNSWLVRNFQGQTYFCGEHAGTHFKAILRYIESNGTSKPRYSPRYGVIKLKAPKSSLNDGFAITSGTDMRSIFKWLQKAGAADFEPLEDDVTLPLSTYCDPKAVTPDIDANAAQSVIGAYGFGDTDFQSLCQAIYQNKAVLLLIKCDDAFWASANPIFTAPKYGHFVVADGYDKNAGYIRIIDSADPNPAFAVKTIAKRYVTPTFIKEAGTAVDIPPELKEQLTQVVAEPMPQNIASTQQNVWILRGIVQIYQLIINLINPPKVGSASESMSPSFSISREQLVSVLKGLGIAAAGAALTYLTSYFANTDFGVWTPVVVTVWSVIINFLRKYVPNTQDTTAASTATQ
jgi:hypothetical protein